MTDLQLNVYNPTCAVNQCLQHVVGSIDGNPLAQYSACTSTFGAPVTSTVTPDVDVIISTLVDTVSYTDIVVSTSTTYSIYEVITTLYTDAFATITETSATTTTTTDTTIVATVTPLKKKRGACKPKTSSSSIVQTATTSSYAQESTYSVGHNYNFSSVAYPSASISLNSSAYPHVTSSAPSATYSSAFYNVSSSSFPTASYSSALYNVSSSSFSTASYSSYSSSIPSNSSSSSFSLDPSSSFVTSYSSAPASSSAVPTSSSSVPVIPIASNCPNLEDYSSACGCIDAVSTTSITSAPTPTSTLTVLTTSTVTIPSTSVSTVTVVITSDVTTLVTTTQTATQTTEATLTETTTTVATATQSAHLKITSATRSTTIVGRYITVGACSSTVPCLQYDYQNTGVSAAGNFRVSDAGVWSLRDSPSLTAYAHESSAGGISAIYFMSSADTSLYSPLSCSVGADGAFTCLSPTYSYNTFVVCGAWLYMIPTNRIAAYQSQCYVLALGLST
ncbi:hypothetical protein M426DRAFT_164247 [Hypoxylon sp. CI-4A]|nr:hypothetical protein M426DRAFT_164247 [Hypoxylon sp. CI-4A]